MLIEFQISFGSKEERICILQYGSVWMQWIKELWTNSSLQTWAIVWIMVPFILIGRIEMSRFLQGEKWWAEFCSVGHFVFKTAIWHLYGDTSRQLKYKSELGRGQDWRYRFANHCQVECI